MYQQILSALQITKELSVLLVILFIINSLF